MANKAQSTTTGHLAPLNNSVSRPEIDTLIRQCVPSGKYAEIESLFDNRVPYTTIREWRRGRAGTPTWAKELVAAKLQAEADRLSAAATRARAIIPGPGQGSVAANILAWHARQKEKAGNKPASDK